MDEREEWYDDEDDEPSDDDGDVLIVLDVKSTATEFVITIA